MDELHKLVQLSEMNGRGGAVPESAWRMAFCRHIPSHKVPSQAFDRVLSTLQANGFIDLTDDMVRILRQPFGPTTGAAGVDAADVDTSVDFARGLRQPH
jgi:hypothetical protein